MTRKVFFYLKIFVLQHAFGAGKDLSLRANFFTTLLGSMCFFYLHIVSFGLIISRFSFTHWNLGQLWALLYTFQIFTYLAFYFFWRGAVHLPREINVGAFDTLLTKPVNLRFLSFFRNGSLHNLISAVISGVYLIHTLAVYHLVVNIFSILLYLFFLAVSLWIFHCASVLFTVLNFKYGNLPGTAIGPFEFQEAMKYPADAFSFDSWWQKLLIYPFALLVTVPTAFLIHKSFSPGLLSIYLILVVGLTYISQKSWVSSLRHYSSASS